MVYITLTIVLEGSEGGFLLRVCCVGMCRLARDKDEVRRTTCGATQRMLLRSLRIFKRETKICTDSRKCLRLIRIIRTPKPNSYPQ